MDDDLFPFMLALLVAILLLSGCASREIYEVKPLTLHTLYTPCPAPARPELAELSPESHLGGPVNSGRLAAILDRLIFYAADLEDALNCYRSQAAKPETKQQETLP